MVTLSKYYLIITMVTATQSSVGTDMFIFHKKMTHNNNVWTDLMQTQINICGLQ